MKIAVHTENQELFNTFRDYKDPNYHVINLTVDSLKKLEDDVDAYIILDSNYTQKIVDSVKRFYPYVPVIFIKNASSNIVRGVDIVIPYFTDYNDLVKVVLYNVNMYTKTFNTLQRLTSKLGDKIEFGDCVYDPSNRTLYHNNKEIKKLSIKEGGILEVLSSNYKSTVKKDIILEKVWHKTDYFTKRSMDVYITYLRNTFRENEINMNIRNISGIGLILE